MINLTNKDVHTIFTFKYYNIHLLNNGITLLIIFLLKIWLLLVLFNDLIKDFFLHQ